VIENAQTQNKDFKMKDITFNQTINEDLYEIKATKIVDEAKYLSTLRSKTLREKGWKLGKLASKVGISSQYLSDILSGKKQPSYPLCMKLEEQTEITFLWFILPPSKARYFCLDKF
jgi:ribosome-binding protein aMBF1 (putative translation factor)